MKLILNISAVLLFFNTSFAHKKCILKKEDVPTVYTYQAEDRTNQNSTNNKNNHLGFTGTGYVDFGGKDSYVEWDGIIISKSEKVNFSFRYANGSNVNRSCELFIDNTSYGIIDFSQVASGDWNQWGIIEKMITLASGEYKVKLVASTNSGGPNLDKMEIVTSSIDDDTENDNTSESKGADHKFTFDVGLASCSAAHQGGSSTESEGVNYKFTFDTELVICAATHSNIAANEKTFINEKNLNKRNSFTIWPNPTDGELIYLQLQEPIEQEVQITVYSISGTAIFNEYKPKLEGTRYSLSLKDVPKGVYIVKIVTAKQNLQSKLIIK
ncbi:T9SS type A sorting domain-containing protein [Tenacibaculum agarivorans]|uniref:T9SS type A sorting domain-containing protein n=1 Tax=Tenacibaculum agarivorans TaxID=1908389 RepID=UPI00094B9A58|nr:T9SS type A sorting domain-containing protein [Tenacibaculum agarivorans]